VVPQLTVLLVEDHAIVREGTRAMLERDDSVVIVGEAQDGASAVAMARTLRPDVVLTDLELPIIDGLEVTRQIRARPDAPKVLVLSACDDPDCVRDAIAAGANGYLIKRATSRDIVTAMHAVSRGELVIHPAVARDFFSGTGSVARRNGLTEREMDVLRLAATGARNKEIGDRLGLSTRTIEAHFTTIFNKLGVSSRTEAVVRVVAPERRGAPRGEG